MVWALAYFLIALATQVTVARGLDGGFTSGMTARERLSVGGLYGTFWPLWWGIGLVDWIQNRG